MIVYAILMSYIEILQIPMRKIKCQQILCFSLFRFRGVVGWVSDNSIVQILKSVGKNGRSLMGISLHFICGVYIKCMEQKPTQNLLEAPQITYCSVYFCFSLVGRYNGCCRYARCFQDFCFQIQHNLQMYNLFMSCAFMYEFSECRNYRRGTKDTGNLVPHPLLFFSFLSCLVIAMFFTGPNY